MSPNIFLLAKKTPSSFPSPPAFAMQCWAVTQEHFKKWKSHLDLRLVHLAAGSLKVPGYSMFVYVSPHHFTWHVGNMTLKTDLFHWNASSRGAGSCGAQEQCWYGTNCKYFPSIIIFSFRYVHRETCLSLQKTFSILLVGHIRVNVFSF